MVLGPGFINTLKVRAVDVRLRIFFLVARKKGKIFNFRIKFYGNILIKRWTKFPKLPFVI